MKTSIIILLLFLSYNLKADSYIDSIQIAGLCKVWGFLKYYHPDVARKKLDWDNILIKKYDEFIVKNDKQLYNRKILSLIDTLSCKDNKERITVELFDAIINDKIYVLSNFKFLSDTSKYINKVSFAWINNDIFSKQVKYKLAEILLNYNPINSKYLKGNKVVHHIENDFKDIDTITTPYKLLALFRYWNVINYFFPYKNLSDYNWDTVLIQTIPKIIETKNYKEYIIQLTQLSAKINDSHGFYKFTSTKYYKTEQNRYNTEGKAKGYIPYNFSLIGDNIVVSKTLLDSTLLDVGDTVIAVNKVNFMDYRSQFDSVRSFSSIQSEIYSYEINLSNWYASKFNISVIKNKDTLNITENQTVEKDVKIESRYRKPPFYYLIDDDIGYVELTQISPTHLSRAFRKFKNKNTIIFDMRGYPETLAPLLLPHLLQNHSNEVAQYYYPNKKYPGTFIKEEKALTYNYWYTKLFVLFKKRYNGKIVVLINNEAVSYSETVCMMFKSCNNEVKFIGAPTAGANGNITSIDVPGGISFRFSSLDWRFPDGSRLQRIGITPDVYVNETIRGLVLNKDEILEKAIQYIKAYY